MGLRRVVNEKLWRAFEAPLTEYRDAGGHVRMGHHASGVHEVWTLESCALVRQCYIITKIITLYTDPMLNVHVVVGVHGSFLL